MGKGIKYKHTKSGSDKYGIIIKTGNLKYHKRLFYVTTQIYLKSYSNG